MPPWGGGVVTKRYGADTPCVHAVRDLLPGLSSHLALQCDMDLPAAHFSPVDPSGRLFRFARVSEARLHSASTPLSLLLWWGAAARLPLDALVQLGWEAFRGAIPAARHLVQVRPGALTEAASLLHGGADAPGSLAVAQWWREREADVLADTLRLDRQQLRDANITSTTSRIFRLGGPRFQLVQRVSADGLHFPSDPSAFKTEALVSARSSPPSTLCSFGCRPCRCGVPCLSQSAGVIWWTRTPVG